ncbi:MAG: creatininase family protein [Fibrobacterota bacterium]
MMNRQTTNLESLTPSAAHQRLQEASVLIVPLTAPESCGDDLPLNGAAAVCTRLSHDAAAGVNGLCTSSLNYTWNTPFQSLPGVLTVDRRTAIRQCAALIRSASLQGVQRVVFLDQSVLSDGIEGPLNKRYGDFLRDTVPYGFIRWQNIGVLRAALNNCLTGLEELWRSEAAVVCLYHELFRPGKPLSAQKGTLLDRKLFSRWKKRGMDPEKLSAYLQTYRLSVWNASALAPRIYETALQAVIEEINKTVEI